MVVRFLPAILLVATPCASPRHKADALKSVEEFHRLFNDSRFSEIYDNADNEVKVAMSREEFLESMMAMREGQGRVLKTEEIATASDSSVDVNRIRILVLVTFEKGHAREEFLYNISGDKMTLAGYHFLGK